MRALVQRVSAASVTIGDDVVGQIADGLLVYVGVGHGDDDRAADFLADKIAGLRIFEDAEGRMNLDVKQVGGAILAVSSFSLYADARKGRRPSFVEAAPPEAANLLYERVCERIRAAGIRVETGRFRETMRVQSVNAGPINILLDTAQA